MTKTQTVLMDRAGALALQDSPLPPPGPMEAQVRIEASGVAYADLVMRTGMYPGVRAPVVPGYDFVGVVEALGEGADAFAKVGDRVVAVTVTGSYAWARNVDARWLAKAPAGLHAPQIVAATMNGLTAWQMFHRLAQPAPGESVLIHGAAGGVGSLLLDLARAAGAKAIGTASKAKHGFVEAKGGAPIDYRSEDFVARARALSGGGVAAGFDHLGGSHFARTMKALRPGGVGVVYGAYDATKGGKAKPLAMLDLLIGSSLNTLSLFSVSKGAVGYNVQTGRDSRPAAYRADLAALMAALEAGVLQPEVAAVLPLAKAAEAHRMLESASVVGKIVLAG
jgi:NADPH:quinone reductase-like Zn-dependent oxidoreductase